MKNWRVKLGKCAPIQFALSVIVGLAVISAPSTFSQPTPDLTGTWEFIMISMDVNWDGDMNPFVVKFSGYLYQDDFTSPTEPNLHAVMPGEGSMDGFIQGNRMVNYKNNDDHCGGDNIGRDLIIGTVIEKGNGFIRDGMGFDSNLGCGASWSYKIKAHKKANDVP